MRWNLSPEVKRNFRIDSASAALVGLFSGMVYPFLAVIAVRFGGGSLETGIIAAAPFIGNILAVLWGRWSEGRPKIPIIFYTLGTARLLILLLAFVSSSWEVVAVALLHFVVASMATPAYVSLMGKIYPAHIRASLMAYVRVLLGILMVAGTYAAGQLYDRGMYWGFAIAAMFGFVSTVLFRGVSEPADQPSAVQRVVNVTWSDMVSVIRGDRRFRWYLYGFFIFEFAFLLPSAVYPIYQVKTLGLTYEEIGWISIIWSVAWFLSYPVWGRIIDRTTPLVAMIGSIVFNSAVPFIYVLEPNFWLCAVAGVFGAFAASAVDLAWINQVNRMAGERSSTYSGIHLTLVGLRGLVTPLVGVGLYQLWGSGGLFLCASVLILLAIVPFAKLWVMEKPANRPRLRKPRIKQAPRSV